MSRFLTLLGLGIIIGVLIAPEKGSVTRQKISDLLEDLGEAGHHLAESVPDVPKMTPNDL